MARLERLKDAARAQRRRPHADIAAPGTRDVSHIERMQTDLDRLSVQEYADYLLSVLLTECGGSGGHLYRVSRDGRPFLAARRGALHPGAELVERVIGYLSRVGELDDAATQVVPDAEDSAGDAADPLYLPVILRAHDGTTRGVALLRGADLTVSPLRPALFAAVADALQRVPLHATRSTLTDEEQVARQ